MLRVLSLRRSSAAYSVVVLPEPVGPVTSRMPCGLWISSSISCCVCGVHAERCRARAGRPACRAGAAPRARRARRESSTRARRPSGPRPQADAAVLRQALLGDVEPRHDLDARHHHRRHGALRLQHFAQHAVDAEAHHQPVLERLDVDVGGVLAHRLGQHGIDQADDRRVVVALEQVGLLGQLLRPGGRGRCCLRAPRRPASTRCRPRRSSAAAHRTRRDRPACSSAARAAAGEPRRGRSARPGCGTGTRPCHPRAGAPAGRSGGRRRTAGASAARRPAPGPPRHRST